MILTNYFAQLDDIFYHKNNPSPASNPSLFLWNDNLAQELSLSQKMTSDQNLLADIFSGNKVLSTSTPLSAIYAGHQFGHFSPQLGDGRAHLLGEVKNKNDEIVEIQLKGSGISRFSRQGDGRCALGPAIREFIMSEAMHALGVPTTRSLAVTKTGDQVIRQQIFPGAIVTRTASSHIRVGTFEYFASKGNNDAVAQLANFAISRHCSHIDLNDSNRFLLFIEHVMDKQIQLITHWMRVGFIHGVMNTDNTTISGETIDYGPCAFMGQYDPATVYSSIDTQGRYGFGNQPAIVQWNLTRLAECFIPLASENEKESIESIEALITTFSDKFNDSYLNMMIGKIGLTQTQGNHLELITELLTLLKKHKLDYTSTFNVLTDSVTLSHPPTHLVAPLQPWAENWIAQLKEEAENTQEIQIRMRKSNPLVIPRNHHMEATINACVESGEPFEAHQFLDVLKSPYQLKKNTHHYQDTPDDDDKHYQTFCGT